MGIDKIPYEVLKNHDVKLVVYKLLVTLFEHLRLRLSGGFTPCRHLRPSSGREHTIVTYSVR